MQAALLVLVVATALAFAWTNGMHDAANAVATSLSTGALTARVALVMAAVLNAVGAMLGVGVAQTVGTQLVEVPVAAPGLGVVLAALVAAIAWNLVTWWFGLPSSSSHALIGGLAGAGLAVGARVDWEVMRDLVLLPTVLSPLLGFAGAWLFMVVLARWARRTERGRALRRFRLAQTVSAAAMALGHGLQDGQKTMGVIVLALGAGGAAAPTGASDGVPLWVRLAAAVAIGLGTAAGGWRIIATLGRRITRIDAPVGFASETVAAGVLYGAAGLAGAPISTTHVITASVLGAASTRGLRTVRWDVVRRIALAWVLTPLVTGGFAAALCAAAALPG